MWLKEKVYPEYNDMVPFKALSSRSPKLITSISDAKSVTCSSNYMAVLTKSGYFNIAYVTNRGDVYLLGETFWEHDPTFDLTIPKKLNGIENADAIYGGGVVYVIKDNQIYIIRRVRQSWGCK